ncbi:MAG TPA: prepilin peptidase [Candidatus Saccharimonadales bacterium]|nr:prepilin peptidase [Candidatus Saccharimonadales bacterium]
MIVAIVVLFGLVLGSFVNALVWRLHEQDMLHGKKTKTAAKRRAALSITKGRSMCPHCGHELAAKDLVPLFSWLYLRGKCRYCQTPISRQYPIVEAATAALFAWSYLAWPYGLHGVGLFQLMCWLLMLVGFVALAVYDLRWFTLPDRIVLPLTVLGLVLVAVSAVWVQRFTALWQPLVAAAIIFGLFYVLYQASGGKWIGGGDVKLAGVLGLLAATPAKAFLVIFVASLLGTLGSLPALVKGKRGLGMHIPFGPYLLLGTVLTVLYGTQLINWYQSLLVG